MTTYFVSRHEQAHAWLRRQISLGQQEVTVDEWIPHLESHRVAPGDLVIGILPLSEILDIKKRGAQFKAIVMDVPENRRGQELSVAEMDEYGAALMDVAIMPEARIGTMTSPDENISEQLAVPREIRISFVSQQLTPQLLAALQYHAQTDEIVLLAYKSMQGRQKLLKDMLAEQLGGKIEISTRKVGEPGSYSEILAVAHEELDRANKKHPDATLIVDLTGGTKLMALALYVATGRLRERGIDARCQYTNTEANQFEWVLPASPPEAMAVTLTIRELLAAQGRKVLSIASEDPEAHRQGTKRQALTEKGMMEQRPDTIGLLNMWAHPAREHFNNARSDGPYTVTTQMLPKGARPGHQGALKFLEDWQAIEITTDNKTRACTKIQFNGKSWADYLSGGWLEEWAWLEAKTLSPDDVAWGVTISDTRGTTSNEFDLVVVHHNRLLVVEVKTAALAQRDTKAANIAYALDSKSNLVGQIYCTHALISFQSLDESAIQRFQDSKTAIFCSPTSGNKQDRRTYPLARFREMVERWMTDGKLPHNPT